MPLRHYVAAENADRVNPSAHYAVLLLQAAMVLDVQQHYDDIKQSVAVRSRVLKSTLTRN